MSTPEWEAIIPVPASQQHALYPEHGGSSEDALAVFGYGERTREPYVLDPQRGIVHASEMLAKWFVGWEWTSEGIASAFGSRGLCG